MEQDRRSASQADEMNCFSCKSTLANVAPVLNNETWTATCPGCAVVNKLTPKADHEGHFIVSGAFFIVKKD